MVYLFEEKQLKDMIGSSSTGNSSQLVSQLYGQMRGVSVLNSSTTTAYGDSLYNMIWQPVDSLLQGVENVYYSPSGLLHNISFSAIPVNDSTLLVDKYDLSLMSTTADIVLNKEPEFKNVHAAVYGGITYDLTPEEMESTTQKYHKNGNDMLAYTRGWVYDDTLRGGDWSYLNGTLTEAERVSVILKDHDAEVNTYIGSDASEEAFKALSGKNSPEIIHLATHGFFFPDPAKKKHNRMMFQQIGDNAYTTAENPLMRSGLLFAGANNVWKGGEIPGELEDGVLTAYEVSGLDLFNTKLVTLSACETGLGDIQGTEGVYGLQRSFKMAGVDYLIMSLWQVPDKETQEFMELFYNNLTSGQSIGKAFRNTQRVMRQKYEPFYWAGFVLLE
jgi:CHAT domain-containing protein